MTVPWAVARAATASVAAVWAVAVLVAAIRVVTAWGAAIWVPV
ncbi:MULTISPECIES: hypothetical protein [Actinosynnema]|nr:hypothetical protein [Actinosynnema pretiosum]